MGCVYSQEGAKCASLCWHKPVCKVYTVELKTEWRKNSAVVFGMPSTPSSSSSSTEEIRKSCRLVDMLTMRPVSQYDVKWEFGDSLSSDSTAEAPGEQDSIEIVS